MGQRKTFLVESWSECCSPDVLRPRKSIPGVGQPWGEPYGGQDSREAGAQTPSSPPSPVLPSPSLTCPHLPELSCLLKPRHMQLMDMILSDELFFLQIRNICCQVLIYILWGRSPVVQLVCNEICCPLQCICICKSLLNVPGQERASWCGRYGCGWRVESRWGSGTSGSGHAGDTRASRSEAGRLACGAPRRGCGQ